MWLTLSLSVGAQAWLAAGGEVRAKAGCEPQKFIRELRGDVEGYEVGSRGRPSICSKG